MVCQSYGAAVENFGAVEGVGVCRGLWFRVWGVRLFGSSQNKQDPKFKTQP